jgi:hypothetical protein
MAGLRLARQLLHSDWNRFQNEARRDVAGTGVKIGYKLP